MGLSPPVGHAALTGGKDGERKMGSERRVGGVGRTVDVLPEQRKWAKMERKEASVWAAVLLP